MAWSFIGADSGWVVFVFCMRSWTARRGFGKDYSGIWPTKYFRNEGRRRNLAWRVQGEAIDWFFTGLVGSPIANRHDPAKPATNTMMLHALATP